jgi:branched-subunit amino acid transport protein
MYAGKKYADKESVWISVIGIFIVVLLISKLFLINLLPENLSRIVSVTTYYSWLLVIAAFIFIGIKHKRSSIHPD